jgi:hypothetical protein
LSFGGAAVRAARVAPLLLALAACTPTRHRLKPYSEDAAVATALEQRAAAKCCVQRPQCDLPPHPFTTDGCSLWMDGNWVDCCVEHDIAYWCGGTAQDRCRADQALKDCVTAKHDAFLGTVMYVGTRVGGAAWLPTSFRWGYGWDWLQDPPPEPPKQSTPVEAK